MKQRNKILIGIGVIILISCNSYVNEESLETSPVSSFNLEADYLNFKEKLEDGDTLRLFAEIGVCTIEHNENNIFIKRNGKLFIQSTNKGTFIDSIQFLPEVEYKKCSSDTLSFEYWFKKLGDERRTKKKDRNVSYIISYKTDSICFKSHGLIDAMMLNGHYMRIKQCLYPDFELYKLKDSNNIN